MPNTVGVHLKQSIRCTDSLQQVLVGALPWRGHKLIHSSVDSEHGPFDLSTVLCIHLEVTKQRKRKEEEEEDTEECVKRRFSFQLLKLLWG